MLYFQSSLQCCCNYRSYNNPRGYTDYRRQVTGLPMRGYQCGVIIIPGVIETPGVIITPLITASPNDVVDPGKLTKLSSKNELLTISIHPAFFNICSVSVDS